MSLVRGNITVGSSVMLRMYDHDNPDNNLRWKWRKDPVKVNVTKINEQGFAYSNAMDKATGFCAWSDLEARVAKLLPLRA